MNTNTYYIIGAIAIGFVLYLLVLKMYMKKRKQNQAQNFAKQYNLSELSESEKQSLIFGAIIFQGRKEDIESIIPTNGIDIYKYGLQKDWGIATRQEAISTIETLLGLSKTHYLNELLQSEDVKIQKEITKHRKYIAKLGNFPLDELQSISKTYAWDTTRAVSLAKWCFWCEYISQDEMWKYIETAKEIAQNQGESWKEYTLSFLLGRTMHGFEPVLIVDQAKYLLEKSDLYTKYDFR